MDFKTASNIALSTLAVFALGYLVGASKPAPKDDVASKLMSGIEFQTQCFAMVTEASDKQTEKLAVIAEEIKGQNKELERQIDAQAKILKGLSKKR